MNVVFLDTVHPILEQRLSEAGYNCINATDKDLTTCKELIKNAFGIVIRSRFTIDAQF